MHMRMRRKDLTPGQYKRANNVLRLTMTIMYIIFIVVETNAVTNHLVGKEGYVRLALYVMSIIALNVVVSVFLEKKFAMLFMAFDFAIMYGVLIFGNGAPTVALVFPAILAFMIYLNSRLVVAGTVIGFVLCAIRANTFKMAGDTDSFNIVNLICMGLVITIYCAWRAINLLIAFSKEDQQVIEDKAKEQEEVADAVSEIVGKLEADFHQVLDELHVINESMGNADSAIENIAGSSESTAQEVNKQADMTSQIQTRLESTNHTAEAAKATTESLKETIENGKKIATELQQQSVLVDQNTNKISDTVSQLVRNVEKVSSITESILNISSQTNLLALNASIEAARAGEAGKGFAVVADEIRELADATRVSTEQITDIINELKQVTNETKIGIEESTESINVQREKVEEVTANFTAMEEGMQELHVDMGSMSEEVEEVLHANTAIVDSISLLSSTSEEVSAGAQTSKETIGNTLESLKSFSRTMDGTFEQLQNLKEAAKVK